MRGAKGSGEYELTNQEINKPTILNFTYRDKTHQHQLVFNFSQHIFESLLVPKFMFEMFEQMLCCNL